MRAQHIQGKKGNEKLNAGALLLPVTTARDSRHPVSFNRLHAILPLVHADQLAPYLFRSAPLLLLRQIPLNRFHAVPPVLDLNSRNEDGCEYNHSYLNNSNWSPTRLKKWPDSVKFLPFCSRSEFEQ